MAKDADGKSKKIDVWEFAVPEGVDLSMWAGASSGLLDDSDVGEISAAMQPGSVAVVVIYENRRVLGLVDAWRRDGAHPERLTSPLPRGARPPVIGSIVPRSSAARHQASGLRLLHILRRLGEERSEQDELSRVGIGLRLLWHVAADSAVRRPAGPGDAGRRQHHGRERDRRADEHGRSYEYAGEEMGVDHLRFPVLVVFTLLILMIIQRVS